MATHVQNPAVAGVPLVLGGNVFGWTADRDTSFRVLDAFYAAGGRMVDTAESYSAWVPGHKGGESETVIGAWMRARRNRADMRIATKVNGPGTPGGLAPEKVAKALEGSLARLQTDHVDLYYSHRDDTQTPLEEIAQGYETLVRAGKVRALGASNFTAARLAAARAAAKSKNATPYTVIQNEYNLVTRDQHEGAIQDLCVADGIVALPYYGLASGYLTGKYRSAADLAGRARGSSAERYMVKGAPVLAAMDRIAAETGASLACIALAWIMAQPGVAAPIASATSVAQVEELVSATRLTLSPAHLALLTQPAGYHP